MTLRMKILAVAGAVFLCALALTYGLSQRIVLGSFARLEEQSVRTNVKRVLEALNEELTGLETTTRNDFQEPVEGSLAVERFLDAGGIAALGKRTHLKVEILRADASDTPADYREARSLISEASPVVVLKLDAERVAGYAHLLDIDGNPRLTLKVEMARDIFNHGKTSVFYFMLAVFLMGLLIIVVLVFALQNLVLGPVSTLSNHAVRIGREDDPTGRLSMDRSDEIGTLAREFDRMAERLSESRKRLLDQTYAIGMAGMASNVLHNVRNALVPEIGRLERLRTSLGEIPLEEISMAREELGDPEVSESRKKDLHRFLRLANQSVAKKIAIALDEGAKIGEEMLGIERILSKCEKFSHAEQPSEKVLLAALVQDALGAVGEEILESVEVDIDPGLENIRPLKVRRIPLQNVLSSLFENAAVSIRKTETKSGKIRVRAAEEKLDDGEKVRLTIGYNGAGFAPEDLRRISSRDESNGDGDMEGFSLHACANTVAAMGGRLEIESDGERRGGSFHVLVPRED